MQLNKLLLPLTVCLTLSGCAATEYYFGKEGASADDFQRDKTACDDEAFTASNVFGGKYVEMRNACLLKKGWKEMPAPATQPAK